MAEDDDKDDKTEDATPRRREESREGGQVALSTEIVAAASLSACIGLLVVGGGLLAAHSGVLIRDSVESLALHGRDDLSAVDMAGMVTASFRSMAWPVAAMSLPIAGVVMFASYAQIGIQIAPKAITWNPGRLDPTKGWSRIFSMRSVVRTIAALLKILLVTTAAAAVAWHELPNVASLVNSDLGPALMGIGRVLLHCALGSLVAIVAIAGFDFGFQRWQHERDIRMSKRDIKDEVKMTEGDPHIKAKVRQVQREMARRRMMAEVPKATVVITNPTHYAVALRYERDTNELKNRAPVVVAKGVDLVAQRIKQVAREADVPLHEDVPLARALHAQVEIGQEVPEALFQAVAGVLAYVFRVRDAARPGGATQTAAATHITEATRTAGASR
jgi:flagellar biosynthetic protein FlhB